MDILALLARPAPAPKNGRFADGMYRYRVNGVEIRAHVENGKVQQWQRNGQWADPREFATLDFNGYLRDELAERERLAGLLAPVEFFPSAVVLHDRGFGQNNYGMPL